MMDKDAKALLDKFPEIQRKHLNIELLNSVLGMSTSKRSSINEMRELATRMANERGVDHTEILCDILRYYRHVKGHSLNYG